MSKKSCFTVNGKPFFSLGGQTHNSSSYVLTEMTRSWASVKALGGNTVATPIPWDAWEPSEGSFNRKFVTDLIDTAREQGLHLIFLWFATWKNGTMEYCPAWVKRDRTRFQRCLLKDGTAIHQLSSHCRENLEADKRAYVELCRLIKEYDGNVQTVIGLQIENEPGILGGTRRDFSELGEAAFKSNVPHHLIAYCKENPSSLLSKEWRSAGAAEDGDWAAVFGRCGAEALTAYSIAIYIDEIAAAGKSVYEDIFMYMNVWLSGASRGLGSGIGGVDWPAGGANIENLDIYYATVKNLDAISPDNYNNVVFRHRETNEAFANPEKGWPLYVPESRADSLNSSQMFDAVAQLGAIGYHIFGSESIVDDDGDLISRALPMKHSMTMLTAAAPLIEKYRGTDKIFSCAQQPDETDFIFRDFAGKWKGLTSFTTSRMSTDFRHRTAEPANELGRVMIFQVSENEFYMIGENACIRFIEREPIDGSLTPILSSTFLHTANAEFICVEEGHFDDEGNYIVDVVRSGDEDRHGVWLAWDVGVVHVVLD